MKITVTFKTPDAGDNALRDLGIEKDSPEYEIARPVLDQFIEFDEYIYVEIDTVKGTAKVLRSE